MDLDIAIAVSALTGVVGLGAGYYLGWVSRFKIERERDRRWVEALQPRVTHERPVLRLIMGGRE